LTKQAACVDRYREFTGESERYYGFKRSPDSKGSDLLPLLVKPREEIQETKEEKKRDRRKEARAEETGGDASGHKVSLVTSATQNVLMSWRIVRTS